MARSSSSSSSEWSESDIELSSKKKKKKKKRKRRGKEKRRKKEKELSKGAHNPTKSSESIDCKGETFRSDIVVYSSVIRKRADSSSSSSWSSGLEDEGGLAEIKKGSKANFDSRNQITQLAKDLVPKLLGSKITCKCEENDQFHRKKDKKLGILNHMDLERREREDENKKCSSKERFILKEQEQLSSHLSEEACKGRMSGDQPRQKLKSKSRSRSLSQSRKFLSDEMSTLEENSKDKSISYSSSGYSRPRRKQKKRSKSRSRSRSRTRKRSPSRSRSRSGSRSMHRRSREMSTERSDGRARKRSRRRSGTETRSRSRTRSKTRSRSRSRSRLRSRTRSRSRSHSRSRSRKRNIHKSRYFRKRSKSRSGERFDSPNIAKRRVSPRRSRTRSRSSTRSRSVSPRKSNSKKSSIPEIVRQNSLHSTTTTSAASQANKGDKNDNNESSPRGNFVGQQVDVGNKVGDKLLKDLSCPKKIEIKLSTSVTTISNNASQGAASKASLYGEWQPVKQAPKRTAELAAWTDFCKMLSKAENEELEEHVKDSKEDKSEPNKETAIDLSDTIQHPFAVKPPPPVPMFPGVIMTPAQAIAAGIIIPTYAPSLPISSSTNLKDSFPVSSGQDHRCKEVSTGGEEGSKIGGSQLLEASKMASSFLGFQDYNEGRKSIFRTGGFSQKISKDFMHSLTPVRGGIGEKLLQKMGWEQGQPLGRRKEGFVNPLEFDVKFDRKGLCSAEENVRLEVRNQASIAPISTIGPGGKHPVSTLMELCTKRKWPPPDFQLLLDDGPPHKKSFLFKVFVNSVWYQSTSTSKTKKDAKAQAALSALKGLGVPL